MFRIAELDTPMIPRILLTGPPGCGKTTVVIETLKRLGDLRVAGFYTREVRRADSRTGFDAVGLSSGQSVRLASVRSGSKVRVGRYGVELPEFERLLAKEFRDPPSDVDLVVIDEIGKMECYSRRFREIVHESLKGRVPLLATVAEKGMGLIHEVKSRTDVERQTVTTANRDGLPERLAERLGSRPG